MKTKELFNQYLQQRHTMQLATLVDSKPWICTVRYVIDNRYNLYWTSLPTRRHSQDIEQQPSVAATVVVHDVIGEPVIAIQMEGEAVQLKQAEYDRQIVDEYASKFLRDEHWIEDFMLGRTEHRLYKLTPSTIYLFDEKNFPGGQRQHVPIAAK